jgi:recombinational DNA repair protein RecT
MSTPAPTNGTNGTTAPATTDAQQSEGARFLQLTTRAATKLLEQWVGPERAAEAKGRIASAFQASAMAARNPSDFYAATPASIAHCVAIAALTGMMPGTGAAALAYLVPRRPRKGEAPQLQYQLSHRGLAALARRADLVLLALPCGTQDVLEVTDGEVTRFEPQIDEPPVTWDELRGVVIVVKTSTGQVLFRGWVAKRLIEIRRNGSDSYQFAVKTEWARRTDPWHVWPIEMSMKTAMHYAVSRGWAVIDDTEAVRALSIDGSGDVIDVTPGGAGNAPALPEARGPVKLEDILDAGTEGGQGGDAGDQQQAEETGELASDEQRTALCALIDQADALGGEGKGMSALATAVPDTELEDLTVAQFEAAEKFLAATIKELKAKQAAAAGNRGAAPKAGGAKQGELV